MNPKLSICVITYNHENYIEDCLNSILEQKTNFDYEIIIGDDSSSDRTRDIIENYRIRHPDIIKVILQNERTGGAMNYEDVHSLANGTYICHLDGDDVFKPGKLQLQCDKMDSDPSLNILWHRMRIFNENGAHVDHPHIDSPFLNQKITRAELLLYGPFGPHSSTMYRRKNLELRNRKFHGNDWFISVELIGDGYGMMMPEVLGGYRITSNGLSGGAMANESNRKLLCRCQMEVLQSYPEHKSLIALRALLTALLDLSNLKSYSKYSFMVFLKSRSFPSIFKLPKLIKFYRSSKLPLLFKAN
jgi:glycosyltransferase involved in cell wall biosynthesis